VFQGKCGRIKEMYTQAVQDSSSQKSSSCAAAEEIEAINAQARALKDRFERGEITNEDDDDDEDKKSRIEDLEGVEFGKLKKKIFIYNF